MDEERVVRELAHKISVEPERLGHLRLHFWHLWAALKEAEAHPELPESWRKAPERSIGWRKFQQFHTAMELLGIGRKSRS